MSDADPKVPAVELDEEARQLQLDRIKAEARKTIAEASDHHGKAITPTVGDDALRSTVDLGEGTGSTLTTIVASEQLSRVARRIAEGVAADARDARVFIIDDLSIADDDTVYLLVTDRPRVFSGGPGEGPISVRNT